MLSDAIEAHPLEDTMISVSARFATYLVETGYKLHIKGPVRGTSSKIAQGCRYQDPFPL
jgi:hypothetical protein